MAIESRPSKLGMFHFDPCLPGKKFIVVSEERIISLSRRGSPDGALTPFYFLSFVRAGPNLSWEEEH